MTDEAQVYHGSGNVLKDLDIVVSREEWAALCEKHGSKMRYPYADVIPFRRPPYKPSPDNPLASDGETR